MYFVFYLLVQLLRLFNTTKVSLLGTKVLKTPVNIFTSFLKLFQQL